MPAITQEISPYIFGVSQEPDVVKKPGFLKECQNGYPDIVFGLQKRPGSKYLNTLLDLSDNPVNLVDVKDAFWFSISREEDSLYFGCIIPATYSGSTLSTYGQIRLWNVSTNLECNIVYSDDTDPSSSKDGSGAGTTRAYLTGSSRNDYKTITVEKGTTLLNRKMVVSPSTILTSGSLTGSVSTFASLPVSPAVSSIYKIINTENTQNDDYYVTWNGSSWSETILPGISNGFNNWTAPHNLLKTIDNPTGRDTFTLGEELYSDRTVGDDATNFHPSFVGSTIQDTFFYFNRLGFLSQDNVVMSQPLKADNVSATPQVHDFYNKSAQISIASDPVDLNASSVRSIRLSNVLPAAQGLILFANNEQFMMVADSGVITPQTAIIKSISNYQVDDNLRPVELGGEFYYISKTLRYSHAFRLLTRGMDNDPVTTEVSKIASEYIPSSINQFTSNPQNQFIAMSDSTQSYVWFYKQFMDGGQRQQASWFKWQLPGNSLASRFTNDTMFGLAGTVDNKVIAFEIPLNKSPDDSLLTSAPNIALGPYLDLWTSNTGTPTYDSSTDLTTIPVPANYPILDTSSGAKPCLIFSTTAVAAGSAGAPISNQQCGAFFDATIQGNNFQIIGNFVPDASNYVIGYKYDMILDLPTTFFRSGESADYTASLRISRYKFSFTNSGLVDFQIKNYTDNDEFTTAYSVANTEFYKADTLPIYKQLVFTIPIHQRNEYFNFRIFSDSPYPSTLNKLMWEGVYTPRYYQRS